MKQEEAQEKFIDNYCAYFGEDSCKIIAEFAEKNTKYHHRYKRLEQCPDAGKQNSRNK